MNIVEKRSVVLLEGKKYFLIKSRQFSNISIYRSQQDILRVGPRDIISKEIQLQCELLKLGFPVPRILKRGWISGHYYFVEESLGSKTLGDKFSSDFKLSGSISKEHFKSLVHVISKHLQAQAENIMESSFSKSLRRDDLLLEEFPELSEKTKVAVSKALIGLSIYPTVFTHGDFHPGNILSGGVIDLETFAKAPIGYDLATCIYGNFIMYPRDKKYNYLMPYRYSQQQIETMESLANGVFYQYGLPSFSNYKQHFIILRSIWALVKMSRWPKIQKWRYGLYCALLDKYLLDENIDLVLLNYKS